MKGFLEGHVSCAKVLYFDHTILQMFVVQLSMDFIISEAYQSQRWYFYLFHNDILFLV